MCSGLFVIALREFTDKLLKDVAHICGGYLVGGHIALCRNKFLNNNKQYISVRHCTHLIGKLEICYDVKHISRKALQIGFKVGVDVIRISDKSTKIKLACIVERIACGFAEDTVTGFTLDRHFVQLFSHLHNSVLCRCKSVIKAFQHRHRQNDFAVFVRLEQSDKVCGNLPYKIGFFLNVDICLLLQSIYRHSFISLIEMVRYLTL